MKKIKMHVLLICYLAMLFPLAAHAQISSINSSIFTQTGQTNPVGPGPGPLPMDCPMPSVSASSVYSTLTTSSVTLCAPNTPSSASASAKFTILTNNNVTLRIAFQLYKGTSGGYSSLGIYCNNSSSVFFNASNSGQTLTDAVSISGGVFNTSGNYYIVPLVQFYCTLDNSWKTITSGNSSNIVTISILPQNTANNFYLNGLQNTGTIPVLNQCPSAIQNLIMHNITTGLISSYQIKIEKSTNGITFSAPINSAIVNATSVPSSIDLNTLFGANLLNTYTGYLRITLVVTASGQCDNGTFTIAQVFQISSVTTQTDYSARNKLSFCGTNIKTPQFTLPISTTMPTVESALCSSIGWQGARFTGITNVRVDPGNTWRIQVYEVSNTTWAPVVPLVAPTRQTRVYNNITYTAPNIVDYTGTNSFNGEISFNDNSIAFDITKPPFYNGASGGLDYFRTFYTSAVSALANRVFCVEFSVSVPNGSSTCDVKKYSFFKVVTSANAVNWKTTSNQSGFDQIAEVKPSLYPNPVGNFLYFNDFDFSKNSNINIFDLTGKNMISIENLNINRAGIGVSQLSKGIYYYSILNNGTTYNGKFIKE